MKMKTLLILASLLCVQSSYGDETHQAAQLPISSPAAFGLVSVVTDEEGRLWLENSSSTDVNVDYRITWLVKNTFFELTTSIKGNGKHATGFGAKEYSIIVLRVY